MDRNLTEEEFKEWKADPSTQAILQYLYVCQAVLQSQWAMGQLNSSVPLETHTANLQATEKFRVYSELINLTFEEYMGVMGDESDRESEWLRTRWEGSAVQALRSGAKSHRDSDSGPREGTGVDEGDAGDGGDAGG